MADNCHSEGNYTIAGEENSHAEGNNTFAAGINSHAEGLRATAYGNDSHAEGCYTCAVGNNSHAEGYYTCANGDNSHTEGYQTSANGYGSHAEGYSTSQGYIIAKNIGAHAEGYSETHFIAANGRGSHAEGMETIANADHSHTEGYRTYADGENSHAEGYSTEAKHDNQHVQGIYNDNKADTLFEIGNGDTLLSRSNAFEVYNDGRFSQDNGTTKFKFTQDNNGDKGYIDENNEFHKLVGVEQTPTDTDANYEILFSASPNNDSEVNGIVRKDTGLRYNPSKQSIMEGSQTYAGGEYSHAGGYGAYAYRKASFAHGNTTNKKFNGSSITENGIHCFGFDMSGEEWSENTEVTNSQNGCEGTILNTATVTINLDVQGQYLLFCSSYTISSGAIYGATTRMIVAHGLSTGTPTEVSLGQTQDAPATIGMAANNKITIHNLSSLRATQFSLMRIN
jgi:hypothetical protein